MSLARCIKSLWLFVGAFFVGNCELFGMNPFAVGFLTAICLMDENVIAVFVGLLVGMAIHFPAITLIRYGVLLFSIALLLGLRFMLVVRKNMYIGGLFAALFSMAINYSVAFFSKLNIMTEAILLEGGIIFSATILYAYAIKVIKNDYVKMVVENEAAISVMALFATLLYGMPIKVYGGIVLAEAVALFSMLFAMYKFGFGIGMSWTVICGSIFSAVTDNSDYLTNWMIVAIAAFAIECVLHGGRIVFALSYAMIYYLCGSFFYEALLDENSIKAIVSALFVFLLAPNKFMLRVDDRVGGDALSENSPEWGRLIVSRVNSLAMAFKRIEYTLAGNAGSGIGLHDVGEIIERFTGQLDQAVPLRKTIEANIIAALSERDIQVKNLIMTKSNEERYEVYITARVRRGRIVSAEVLRKIIEREMNVNLVIKDESRRIIGYSYEVICLHEAPAFRCISAVRRMSRFEDTVSGDNFYIGNIGGDQQLIIIADGMGSGQNASEDSCALIESLEELFAAGFDKDMSIRIVNSYLAQRSRGERFTTLDMLLLDLHTGYGKIYKQGAAATYIKRKDWLEMVKSTSLPVGVIEDAACEKCSKKFFDGDLIVMVSDGVLESIIVENKDDYMEELLNGLDSDEPEDVVKDISEQIKAMSGNRLADDATIVACKLVKSL